MRGRRRLLTLPVFGVPCWLVFIERGVERVRGLPSGDVLVLGPHHCVHVLRGWQLLARGRFSWHVHVVCG